MNSKRFCLTVLYLLTHVYISSTLKPEDVEYNVAPTHIIEPRSLQFFSKGPGPDGFKYKGPKFNKHLNNVLSGGSVGLEFDASKVKGLWEKVKNYFPAIRRFEKRSGFLPVDYPEKKDFGERRDPDADLVSLGVINPRIKPPARFEGRDRERMEMP